MITIGDAVAKAKSYIANRTGVPYHSLVLEAIASEQAFYVIKFVEVAALREKMYGHYTIEVDHESGIIKGFEQSRHNTPPPEIEPAVQRKELPDSQFEVIKDTDDTFRFLLRTPTGEVIAVSKVYESKADCLTGIQTVKENAEKAGIHDSTSELTSPSQRS
jgi:uncharacterized protein YegP (UPF0339 family)